MSPPEREVFLYKRKHRDRESALPSYAKRQATPAEIQDEVDNLALLCARVFDMGDGLRWENESLGRSWGREG